MFLYIATCFDPTIINKGKKVTQPWAITEQVLIIIYEDKGPTIPPSHALVPRSLLIDLGSIVVPGDRTS
jgi:hypothetical protein